MSGSEERRKDELREWLANNVATLVDPGHLTLFDFDADWSSWKGTFSVKLDDTVLKDKFQWHLEITGFASFYEPMFFSPLGVPASYSAVEMSDTLRAAMLLALKQTFPKLRPLGRNRDTGTEITYHTPIEYRLSALQFRETKARVTADYAVTVPVGD